MEEMRARIEATPEDALRRHIDLERPGGGLLPSVWYPAVDMHILLDIVMGGRDRPLDIERADRAGPHVFGKQMKGLQKAIFALFMSPPRYVKLAHRAWNHNFDDGELVFETADHWHRCTYVNWTAHHPAVCHMIMRGKKKIYEAMGCKEVQIEIERCDPALGCSSTAVWSD